MGKRRPGFNPGLGRSPGEGNGKPLQYPWPGKSHGQRSLVGCSPWGCKESGTTEWLTLKKTLPAIKNKLGKSSIITYALKLFLWCGDYLLLQSLNTSVESRQNFEALFQQMYQFLLWKLTSFILLKLMLLYIFLEIFHFLEIFKLTHKILHLKFCYNPFF